MVFKSRRNAGVFGNQENALIFGNGNESTASGERTGIFLRGHRSWHEPKSLQDRRNRPGQERKEEQKMLRINLAHFYRDDDRKRL